MENADGHSQKEIHSTEKESSIANRGITDEATLMSKVLMKKEF